MTNMSFMCVNSKTHFYRNNASSYINRKASIFSKEMKVREAGREWHNSEIRELKNVMRKELSFYHKYDNEYY